MEASEIRRTSVLAKLEMVLHVDSDKGQPSALSGQRADNSFPVGTSGNGAREMTK